MNATISICALLAAAPAVDRSSPPPLDAPRPFTVPAPVLLTLDNGLSVWLVERTRAPLIDIVATVEAGMAADPEALPGMASWVSAMLLEGAGARDALAFADAQADAGARIFSSAGPDDASVSLHVSAARFEDALSLFADALTAPRFGPDDWRRVQKTLRADMQQKSLDPPSLAALAAARATWGPTHRFALDVDGTPRSVAAATVDDLRAFHRARYRPDTTTLVVVGAIGKAALKRHLDAALGRWRADGPRPERAQLPSITPRKTRGVIGVQLDDAPQTVLRVVSATATPVLPYDAPVEVMNTLLGGSFTSRLNDNLREQHGYAYGASSRVMTPRAGSVFSVRTSVQANATVPAIDEVLGELARIKTPASSEEIVRARNLVALSFPQQFDGGASIAATLAEARADGLDAARLSEFMRAAPKVDVAAVQGAARRVVDEERCTIVVVGDLRPQKRELARFGPMAMWSAEDLLPGVTSLAAGGE